MKKMIIRIKCKEDGTDTLYAVKNVAIEQLQKYIDWFNKEWEDGTLDDNIYDYLYRFGMGIEEVIGNLKIDATFEI